MEKELEVRKSSTPAEMITLAVNKGTDLDKLEKLLSLQQRWEEGEARKAYNKAMSDFKANPPKIDKDKQVSFGNTKYNHASLANVAEKINSELSKYGLSSSWKTQQNGQIIVTCRITHVQGHSEETSLSAGADTSGSKNSIQALGSTITYLQRYTLLALTGLAAFDQDDDGVSSAVETITEEQRNQIADLLISTKADMGKFLSYMKLQKLDDMKKSDYNKALVSIENVKNVKAVMNGGKK